ncbi:MAG: hypothetical protein JXJ04_02430 [Spirochaetales bacterium]|nr:hypothetical protein [Spirochaetales bacterium]
MTYIALYQSIPAHSIDCTRTPYGLPWLDNWGILQKGNTDNYGSIDIVDPLITAQYYVELITEFTC